MGTRLECSHVVDKAKRVNLVCSVSSFHRILVNVMYLYVHPIFSVNGFHDSSMAAYSPRDCTVRIWRKQRQVCSKNSRLSLVSDTLSSAAHACAGYSSTMRQVSRLGALVSILQSSKYWQGHKSPVFTSITIGHDGFNGQRWISYLDLIKWEMRTCERPNGTCWNSTSRISSNILLTTFKGASEV
jgi:hypothetical protein